MQNDERLPSPFAATVGLHDDDLRDLLALVASTDIEELEVHAGSLRVLLRRDLSGALAAQPGPDAPPATGPAGQAAGRSEPSATERRLAVTSPLVGIFRPVVKVGDRVSPGQALGAIEAMGLRTSVDAPQPGVVEALLSLEGSAVEYGQPLLVLRPEERAAGRSRERP